METSASFEARYAPLLYPTNQVPGGWSLFCVRIRYPVNWAQGYYALRGNCYTPHGRGRPSGIELEEEGPSCFFSPARYKACKLFVGSMKARDKTNMMGEIWWTPKDFRDATYIDVKEMGRRFQCPNCKTRYRPRIS